MIASAVALKAAAAALWRTGMGKATIAVAVLCFGLVCALASMLWLARSDLDEARHALLDAEGMVGKLSMSVALFEAQVERCNASVQRMKEEGEARVKIAEEELVALRARLAKAEAKRAADLTRITRKLPDVKTCKAAVEELRKELVLR